MRLLGHTKPIKRKNKKRKRLFCSLKGPASDMTGDRGLDLQANDIRRHDWLFYRCVWDWVRVASNSSSGPFWRHCHSDMGIPTLKSLPCNATPNPNRLVIWEGDACITRVLEIEMPKTLGCPYHCNRPFFASVLSWISKDLWNLEKVVGGEAALAMVRKNNRTMWKNFLPLPPEKKCIALSSISLWTT